MTIRLETPNPLMADCDCNHKPLNIGDKVYVSAMSKYHGIITGFKNNFVYIKLNNGDEIAYFYTGI